MSKICAKAQRDKIRGLYYQGHLLLMASGMKPTPCHEVDIERSLLDVEPPQFILKSCSETSKVCVQMETPYQFSKAFFIGMKRDNVIVYHRDGKDEIHIEVPEVSSGAPAIRLANAFSGGSIELISRPPREATGYSNDFSIEEAFRDAIHNLPDSKPSYPDELFDVQVITIGVLYGGIAGFNGQLYVRVKA